MIKSNLSFAKIETSNAWEQPMFSHVDLTRMELSLTSPMTVAHALIKMLIFIIDFLARRPRLFVMRMRIV